MNKLEFIDAVIDGARKRNDCEIEDSRNGRQICFKDDDGHTVKKLHEGHLTELYPAILEPDAHIPTLIEAIAPGRPCTHKPMREIVEGIHAQ